MTAQPDFVDPAELWPHPDMGVLRLGRRSPPSLPTEVFGPAWHAWILRAADAAAAPHDYVVAPLLASASALIGNARWASATPGWVEPPHLWLGVVGDSGNGKSPGADCLMRYVIPQLEQRMIADFPDRLRMWRVEAELNKAAEETWKSEVRDAHKAQKAAPMPPTTTNSPEPQSPRLRQHDVTIERIAALLASAAPKGVLICRDELAGWITGMTSYNVAGRSFWVEAYGGRPYRVERQKHPEPIDIAHLVVAAYGGTQPDKLALLMREADDGLFSRFLWAWPEPVPFRLGQDAPGTEWAIAALDRLRELDLQPGRATGTPEPIMVKLVEPAVELIQTFGREMQQRQAGAGGLLRSAYGKARGDALRLALVLEYLWWCGADGTAPPPAQISTGALSAAAELISDYFLPMAERVYGDAALPEVDRLVATVAKWILSSRIAEKKQPIINARELRLREGLPGLREAEKVKLALNALVEADWLAPVPTRAGSNPGRKRDDYIVNPRLKGAGNAE